MDRKKTLVVSLFAICAVAVGLMVRGRIQLEPPVTHHVAARAVDRSSGGSSPLERIANSKTHLLRDTEEVAQILENRRSIAESYPLLEQAALAGNSQASYHLYLDMLRCQTIEQRALVISHLPSPQPTSGTSGNLFAEGQLSEDLRTCEGLTPEQLASKSEWAIRAARQGHIEAKLLFLAAATEKFKSPTDAVKHAEELGQIRREALQHLHDAAAQGNRTAMFNLALSYQEGTLGEKNPVKAYAYLLAYMRKNSSSLVDSLAAKWQRKLSAHDVALAQRLSQSITQGKHP